MQRVEATPRPASWSQRSRDDAFAAKAASTAAPIPSATGSMHAPQHSPDASMTFARADRPRADFGLSDSSTTDRCPTLSDSDRARRPGASGNDRGFGAAGELDDPGPVDGDHARDGILDLGGLPLERTVSCVRGSARYWYKITRSRSPRSFPGWPPLPGATSTRVIRPRSSRPTGATSPATTSTVIPSTSSRHTEHPALDQVVSS